MFQSTLPVGGATWRNTVFCAILCFNPRSPWGERLLSQAQTSYFTDVSIHAPRGGSDWLTISMGTGP